MSRYSLILALTLFLGCSDAASRVSESAASRPRVESSDNLRDAPDRETIEERLERKVKVRFTRMSLKEVLSVLEDEAATGITLDIQRVSERIGSPYNPISINLTHEISLKSALSLILHPMDLTYFVDNDELVVTTLDDSRVIEYEFLQAVQSYEEDFGPIPADVRRRIKTIQDLNEWNAKRKAQPKPAQASPKPDLAITARTYPKVDGSTSTEPLQALIACKVLGAGYEWVHYERDDSRRLRASNRVGFFGMLTDDDKSDLCDFINASVRHYGTHKAYVKLIDAKADLILAARLPSDDEWEFANSNGVTLVLDAVALDAFVFLLNGKNPVSGLSTKQIQDIFSGQIVNWQEVGGANARIQPYQRNRNSGSQHLMRELVMKGRKMIDAPDMLIGTLMAHPFLALNDDVLGIGYSVYFYHEFMSPPARIKACAIDGVLPSPHTIRARRYPFVSEVYVARREDTPADTPVWRLHNWLITSAGQEAVEQTGYIPIRDLGDELQTE